MIDQDKDYGCDPLGNGKWKMIPSGDIVDADERQKRLPPVNMDGRHELLIGSLTANQVEMMQGGKLKR